MASVGSPPPKPAAIWQSGMVACYHPYDRRREIGMGFEKCGVCLYVRETSDEFWPPVGVREALDNPWTR